MRKLIKGKNKFNGEFKEHTNTVMLSLTFLSRTKANNTQHFPVFS